MEKIVPLWPIGYKERAEASFVPYLKDLNFKIFNWIQALNDFIVVFTLKYSTYTGDSIQQHKMK